MLLAFGYDPRKRAGNLKKHGLDFEDAPQVIVTAETEDNIRIISMRKATKDEQEIYYRYA